MNQLESDEECTLKNKLKIYCYIKKMKQIWIWLHVFKGDLNENKEFNVKNESDINSNVARSHWKIKIWSEWPRNLLIKIWKGEASEPKIWKWNDIKYIIYL